MKKEEALEKVHKGTIIVYEGVNSEICIGEVQTISKHGTVGVYDIVNGIVGAGGEYHRSPEEYFIYEIEDSDYYLKNQEKYLHRTPTKEEFFWYKLCMQNIELRESMSQR